MNVCVSKCEWTGLEWSGVEGSAAVRTDSDATRRSAPAARLARLLARIAGTALTHAEARGLPLCSAPIASPSHSQWPVAEQSREPHFECAVRTQSDPIRSDPLAELTTLNSTQLESYTKLRCLCARVRFDLSLLIQSCCVASTCTVRVYPPGRPAARRQISLPLPVYSYTVHNTYGYSSFVLQYFVAM